MIGSEEVDESPSRLRRWSRTLRCLLVPAALLCVACPAARPKSTAEGVNGVPRPAVPTSRPPVSLAAAPDYACALARGFLYCWGLDSAPKKIAVDSPAELASDGENVYVRRANGSVLLVTPSAPPTALPQLGSARRIAGNHGNLCSLTFGGGLLCASNNNSQIDFGTLMNPRETGRYDKPVDVTVGLRNVCVLRLDASAYCLGHDGPRRLTAVERMEFEGSQLCIQAAGRPRTCERERDVKVGGCIMADQTSCWPELGTFRALPGQPRIPLDAATPPLTGKFVAASDRYACALLDDERVVCWGHDDRGQLGNGPPPPISEPRPVDGSAGAMQLAVGPSSSCFVDVDKNARCWGREVDSPSPKAMSDLQSVAELAVTEYDVCAVTTGGAVRCRALKSPSPVTNIEGIVEPHAIVAGDEHFCAIGKAHSVWCWAFRKAGNASGQLGSPDFVPSRPVRVAGVTARKLVLTGSRSCAVELDGTVACWGASLAPDSSAGASGGPKVRRSAGISKVDDYVERHSRMCVRTGKQWRCAGHDDSALANPPEWASVPALTGATTLLLEPIGYDAHLCFAAESGPMRCSTPVAPELVDVRAVEAGEMHACALTKSGVSCWGDGTWGQRGDGRLGFSHSAKTVALPI